MWYNDLVKNEKINCLQCQHYYATYDPTTPRGCRFYGFASQFIPSQVVAKESKSECQGYKQRACFANKAKKKLDLNDPSLW